MASGASTSYIPESEYGPGMLAKREAIQSAMNRCPHGENVTARRCAECDRLGMNYQPSLNTVKKQD